MQIVVKIDENIYRRLKSGNYGLLVSNTCAYEVLNGTPLPKGHGRLIDADAFIEQESCCGYIEDMDIDYFKQSTPTIIEADKESKNANSN